MKIESAPFHRSLSTRIRLKFDAILDTHYNILNIPCSSGSSFESFGYDITLLFK
jgi:hypothetical protein